MTETQETLPHSGNSCISLFFSNQSYFTVFRNIKHVISFTSIWLDRAVKDTAHTNLSVWLEEWGKKAEGKSGVGFHDSLAAATPWIYVTD